MHAGGRGQGTSQPITVDIPAADTSQSLATAHSGDVRLFGRILPCREHPVSHCSGRRDRHDHPSRSDGDPRGGEGRGGVSPAVPPRTTRRFCSSGTRCSSISTSASGVGVDWGAGGRGGGWAGDQTGLISRRLRWNHAQCDDAGRWARPRCTGMESAGIEQQGGLQDAHRPALIMGENPADEKSFVSCGSEKTEGLASCKKTEPRGIRIHVDKSALSLRFWFKKTIFGSFFGAQKNPALCAGIKERSTIFFCRTDSIPAGVSRNLLPE